MTPATAVDENRPAPLADVRVIAVEQAVAGPLCSRHLADLGADVIKVERPDGGDFARAYDSAARGGSAYFVWLNHGKRSVVLDLATDDGRARFERLLDGADVLVHNLGPGALARLGWDEGGLAERWPGLVRCSISGYGPDGPYRHRKAFDLLLQGESGLLHVTGTRDEPAKVGISIADIAAGLYAATAIVAALRQRDRTGRGVALEISMLDCLAEWMTVPALYQRYAGAPPARTGARHATIAPYGPYACADGQVSIAVQTHAQWERLCRLVLERPELTTDERFATNERRVANRTALEPLIEASLAGRIASDVRDRLDRADVPHGDINDVTGLIDHPQLAARDRWLDVATAGGAVTVARPPFGGLEDAALRGRSVPRLGEHDAEVLG